MPRSKTLPAAGFGLSLLVLAAMGVATYLSARHSMDVAERVEDTHADLQELAELLYHATNAESSVRAFVVTGDSAALESYESSAPLIEGDLASLERAGTEHETQRVRLDALRPLVRRRIAVLGEALAARQAGKFEDAQSVMLRGEGRVLMDRIRALVHEMRDEEVARLRIQEDDETASAGRTVKTVIVGALVAMIIAAAAMRLSQREAASARRAEQEARESRDLYHALARHFPDGAVILFDQEMRPLIAEGQGLEAAGFARAQSGRRGVAESFPAEVRAALEQAMRSTLGGTNAVVELELSGRDWLMQVLPVRSEGGMVSGGLAVMQDVTKRKRAEADKERLIEELRLALAQVKTLSGLMPICAWCRKVRDDRGYWDELEGYVARHSAAEFTHGICPDCQARMAAKQA